MEQYEETEYKNINDRKRRNNSKIWLYKKSTNNIEKEITNIIKIPEMIDSIIYDIDGTILEI